MDWNVAMSLEVFAYVEMRYPVRTLCLLGLDKLG